MPETAKRTARVPILGEDGRISDDYVPAAIGEGVEAAEAAAKRAETAATNAEGSATTASQSATGAQGSASAASTSAAQARESATAAGEAVTQAQSAKQAAEAAKAAAETAQSAAAGSAHDAQQSATAAQQSAASVADKFISSAQATTLEPGSEATASVVDQVLTIGVPKGEKGDKGDTGEKGDPGTGVPEGGTPGQLLSKTDSGTAWVDPPSGNVLKGTLGPEPLLSADDAYATKPRKLTVHGETRQNLWVNPSGANGGLTVTSNESGSMTLSGTSSVNHAYIAVSSYILRPSTSYTLSIDMAFSHDMLIGCRINGSFTGFALTAGQTSTTFTTPATLTTLEMGVLVIAAGTTISGTYRVMLNKGSTAEPWCPPGLNSVDELSVVTAGKNLLARMGPELPYTTAGITFSDNGDGGIRISGTASSTAFLDFFSFAPNAAPFIPAGSYALSMAGRVSNVKISVETFDHGIGAERTPWLSIGGQYPATGTVDSPKYLRPFISVAMGTTVDTVVYPQLELGSTATAYEPPAVTTTPVDLDGNTLCSLPDGTCDELVIRADGSCEVERKTAKIVLNGSEEQAIHGPLSAVHGGRYFDILFDMPDNADGVGFSWSSQVADKLRIENGDAYPNAVAVFMNPSTHKTNARISVDGIETVDELKTYLQSNPITLVYTIKDDSTEPQSPVTLPTLPAPTVNVWADAEASGAGYAMDPDVELEYERNINIAFSELQAQISATTVREATNG